MASTETVPPATGTAQKMSRYRSVRRAQEQQQTQYPPQSAPPMPSSPPAQSRYRHQQSAAQPQSPPQMPAVPDVEPQKDAQISRSMSRYHRRPPPPQATTVSPPAVPQPSNSRTRAASSPQNHSANTAQHRPRTARQRGDATGTLSDPSRSPRADEGARDILQRERERQRLLKEKYEAEARTQREAKQAEIDRLERLRREEEEAALEKARQEAQQAEALRALEAESKAEKERGKRLRKAEAQKVLQRRDEEARSAKREQDEHRAKLEAERSRRVASASPPVSPPRHEVNLGVFKRRKDDGLSHGAPAEPARAPQLSLNLGDREEETIRPGGGGIVLGIDAPTSAVNAGDRVCLLLLVLEAC
jgi:hypothetical protein